MAVVIRNARVVAWSPGLPTATRRSWPDGGHRSTTSPVAGARLRIGAGWHEAEHRGYRIEFPSANAGRDARRGADRHPPAVDRGVGELRGPVLPARRHLRAPNRSSARTRRSSSEVHSRRCLRVIARHADGVEHAGRRGPTGGAGSTRLDEACAGSAATSPRGAGRRGCSLHPRDPERVTGQLDLLHAVPKTSAASMRCCRSTNHRMPHCSSAAPLLR